MAEVLHRHGLPVARPGLWDIVVLVSTLIWCLLVPAESTAQVALVDLIPSWKRSVVVVGTFEPLRTPQFSMAGTGFIVGDGSLLVTNAHVISAGDAVSTSTPIWSILAGTSPRVRRLSASVVAIDESHDLALLRLADGERLVPLVLGDSAHVREGQSVALIGFPLGGALGYSHVTHRGIVAAITPIAVSSGRAKELNSTTIQRLRSGAINVFQLDATAYPGNSGGPLFSLETGDVIGILNMVFVKESKEAVLQRPSGISYAIPSNHIQEMLTQVATPSSLAAPDPAN